MDFEDFLVSNNLLPLGSLGYVLFCTSKNGWGWDNFIKEANAGKGMKFPSVLKGYLSYIVPAIIIIIYLKGYYDMFSPKGVKTLACWMTVAVIMLAFVIVCSVAKSGKSKSRASRK